MSSPNLQPPNVNPSPKQRFLDYKPFVDAHRDLIPRPELQRGIDFALQEMVWEMTASDVDGNTAARNHYMLKGAREFVRVLKNLAERPMLPKRMASDKELPYV